MPGQKGVNGPPPTKVEKDKSEEGKEDGDVDKIAEGLKDATLENGEVSEETGTVEENADTGSAEAQDEDGSDSDSGGWITPSNLKKHQARDEAVSLGTAPEAKTMQVATITTDFAVCFYIPIDAD